MIGPTPTLFDALEFDESFAICDILYDLAFLLMDLWTRGLSVEANGLMNRYLSASDAFEAQLAGLAALPLFLSLRAAIRANVTNLEASRTAATIAAARRLFDAACAFFEPRRASSRRNRGAFRDRQNIAWPRARARDRPGARRNSPAQRRRTKAALSSVRASAAAGGRLSTGCVGEDLPASARSRRARPGGGPKRGGRRRPSKAGGANRRRCRGARRRAFHGALARSADGGQAGARFAAPERRIRRRARDRGGPGG